MYFIKPVETTTLEGSILYDMFLSQVDPGNIWIQVVAVILVFFQCFLINQFVSAQGIISPPSMIPGVIFLLVTHCISDFIPFSPILIANSFFIIALFALVGLFRKTGEEKYIFNASFLMSIASMFYFSYILLFLAGIIALNYMRRINLKGLLGILVGFVCPYYLLWVYCYVTQDSQVFWNLALYDNIPARFTYEFTGLTNILKWVTVIFFALMTTLSVRLVFSKKRLKDRKLIAFFYSCIPILLLGLLFQAENSIAYFLSLGVPAGVILGIYFTELKRNNAEAIHLIVLVSCLTLQFLELQNL